MSKFTVQAKTCIKGEAFFESLLAEYAIPHHIQGAKDLGADYLCQWSYSRHFQYLLVSIIPGSIQ